MYYERNFLQKVSLVLFSKNIQYNYFNDRNLLRSFLSRMRAIRESPLQSYFLQIQKNKNETHKRNATNLLYM